MREVEPHDKDKLEVTVSQAQEKQERLIGSEHLHRGHTMFEVDTRTWTFAPAKYETESVVYDPSGTPVSRKLVMKPGFMYVSALNEFNARKKLMKRTFEVLKKHHEANEGRV